MTQKELLYLEDAIGHEDVLIKICEEAVNNLDDEDLVSFIDGELGKHMNMKEKLISFIGEEYGR